MKVLAINVKQSGCVAATVELYSAKCTSTNTSEGMDDTRDLVMGVAIDEVAGSYVMASTATLCGCKTTTSWSLWRLVLQLAAGRARVCKEQQIWPGWW
jgi:hypothetical protein